VQVWSDCAHGVEIISYAWTDTSQSPSPMVLLLVIDDPVDLQDTVDRAIGNIEVGKFPPPQPVDEGESEG
jgi:hypothetical protein